MPNPRNRPVLPYLSLTPSTEFYTMLGDGLVYKALLNDISTFTVLQVGLGTFPGSVIPDDANVKSALQALEAAISGGAQVTTYSAGNGVTVTGTTGITTTKASGTVTIILPVGGYFIAGFVDFAAADATYSNGTVSQALRIRFDNAANGPMISKDVTIYGRTTTGTVTSGNPLQYNTAINLSKQIDELGSGVVAHVFPQVFANAPSGGVAFF